MNLNDLYYGNLPKYNTDKGTVHNYINGYYNLEFSDKFNSNINILEIGLAYGGSAKLWKDWFVNGNVYIIENDPNLIQHIDGVNIILNDAYSENIFEYFKNIEFDYIIDDGPHTFESNVFVIENWINKLKPNGKIIIEDIQRYEWIEIFKNKTQYITNIIDLRETANKRSDDIIFEITKSLKNYD